MGRGSWPGDYPSLDPKDSSLGLGVRITDLGIRVRIPNLGTRVRFCDVESRLGSWAWRLGTDLGTRVTIPGFGTRAHRLGLGTGDQIQKISSLGTRDREVPGLECGVRVLI